MATTAVETVQSEHRPSPLRRRLTPPGAGGRPRNRSAVVAGLILVIGCGAGFAAVYSGAGERTEVLAAAREVPAGTRIGEADLKVVRVGADSSLQLLPTSLRPRVVGRLARVGLVPNSLLTPAHLVQGEAVPTGQSVVAVLLRFGQAPSLRPGDKVLVVAPAQNLTAAAQVFSVESQGRDSGDTRVSLLADEATAARIAAAATSRAEISVVLRSSGS